MKPTEIINTLSKEEINNLLEHIIHYETEEDSKLALLTGAFMQRMTKHLKDTNGDNFKAYIDFRGINKKCTLNIDLEDL